MPASKIIVPAKRRLSSKPDPNQCRDQLEALQALLAALGMESFCAAMIWILGKVPTNIPGVEASRLMPFVFNIIQRHLYKNLARNNRVLKGRQAGITTFFMLVRLLVPAVTQGGVTSLLISQNSLYAQKHFMMARRAYKHFGARDPYDREANELCDALKANVLHTAYSNRRELVFDWLDSNFMVESAEVEEAAQGVTVHHALGSEVARWPGNPEDTMSNVKGAIVPDGTLDEESTANAAAGYFYEQSLRSMDDEQAADARFHYFSWFYSSEYRLEFERNEMAEMLKDLEADEIRLVARMHRELAGVV